MLAWLVYAAVLAAQLPTPRPDPALITVTVTAQEGDPLPGAVVQVAGAAWPVDAEGRVSFTVPEGEVSIEVSADGYTPRRITLRVAAGAPIPVHVALEPLGYEEEVVVTATRSQGRLREQPLRVEVIGREEIEEKALMTPGSVAMLLGETSGLRVQVTAPSLGAANVRMQGLRGRYSQLLSDGLPLYGGQGDSFTLLQVPPLDLAQVEVIKGAASALYGPAALGGVINLVSRRPAEHQHEALLNVTTQGGADATLWLAEPSSGRRGWTLLGGYHGQVRQDLDDDGWTDVASFRRGLVRPRVFWDNGAGRTVFATAGVMRESREGGTVEGGVAPDGQPFAERLDTTRGDGGLVARLLVGGTRVVSLRASASSQHQDRLFGGVRERGTRTTWFTEASVQGAAGRHTWVAGAAWQQDRYRPEDLPQFAYTYRVPALFVQDEVILSDVLSLAASARLDAHDEYGTLAAPRLSFMARPGGGWTIRLSGGGGSFAPTPFTEETDEAGLSRLATPSGLRAERVAGGSIDVSRSAGPFEVIGTVFGSRVVHPLELRTAGEAQVTLANAETPTETVGTELIVRYRRGAVGAMLTHAWTRSREGDPESGARRDVPLTPRHALSFNIMWEGEDWGRVGLEAYYTGRQALDENPYRAESRPYVLVGALGERRVGPVRVFINAENIGNVRQTHWDRLVRTTPRPDGRWTVDAWAPLDGLVVNGGVRLAF